MEILSLTSALDKKISEDQVSVALETLIEKMIFLTVVGVIK